MYEVMSEGTQWGLIGYRNHNDNPNIGGEVARQLSQPEVAAGLNINPFPNFLIRSSGIKQPDGETPSEYKSLEDIEELPDVTFVAMPSTDDGTEAYQYISHVLDRGKIAVTA